MTSGHPKISPDRIVPQLRRFLYYLGTGSIDHLTFRLILRRLQWLLAEAGKSPLDDFDAERITRLKSIAEFSSSAALLEYFEQDPVAAAELVSEQISSVLPLLEHAAGLANPDEIVTREGDDLLLVVDLDVVPPVVAAELMGALDELHRAHGGGGLVIRSAHTGSAAAVRVSA